MDIKFGIRGWKTALAGVLSIVWGIGGLITGIHDANAAMNYFISGFGILGVGHKLDKLREDAEEPVAEENSNESLEVDTSCKCCCKCCKK